jgi:multimeric flavodoxin WrbA
MKKKVLGIYGSPRKSANTDKILEKALEGARTEGAETSAIYARDLQIGGCIECGGCDKTGKCVVQDEMQDVYALLEDADIIFLATPNFFYGMPAQVKALIDRCQAMWSKKALEKKPEERKQYNGGKGYLLAIGATRGKNLFEGMKLTAKYFFDALDMRYEDGLLFWGIEKRSDLKKRPDILEEAFEFGKKVAAENWQA